MSKKAQDIRLAKIGYQAASGVVTTGWAGKDKKKVRGPKQVSGEYRNVYWGKYKIMKKVYGMEPAAHQEKGYQANKSGIMNRIGGRKSIRGGRVTSIVSIGIINKGIGKTIYGKSYEGEIGIEEKKLDLNIYEKGLAISRGEAKNWCEKGHIKTDGVRADNEKFVEGQVWELGLTTVEHQVKAKMIENVLSRKLSSLKRKNKINSKLFWNNKNRLEKSNSIEGMFNQKGVNVQKTVDRGKDSILEMTEALESSIRTQQLRARILNQVEYKKGQILRETHRLIEQGGLSTKSIKKVGFYEKEIVGDLKGEVVEYVVTRKLWGERLPYRGNTMKKYTTRA